MLTSEKEAVYHVVQRRASRSGRSRPAVSLLQEPGEGGGTSTMFSHEAQAPYKPTATPSLLGYLTSGLLSHNMALTLALIRKVSG